VGKPEGKRPLGRPRHTRCEALSDSGYKVIVFWEVAPCSLLDSEEHNASFSV
jgi:hypothetical protein